MNSNFFRSAALAAFSSIASMALVACSGNGSGDSATNQTTSQTQAATTGTKRALAVAAPAASQWSTLTTLPLVPVSMAHLPDGKIHDVASDTKFNFAVSGLTYGLTLDPATGAISERTISETGHNMFCPGTANLADGRIASERRRQRVSYTSIYRRVHRKMVNWCQLMNTWPAVINANTPLSRMGIRLHAGRLLERRHWRQAKNA